MVSILSYIILLLCKNNINHYTRIIFIDQLFVIRSMNSDLNFMSPVINITIEIN